MVMQAERRPISPPIEPAMPLPVVDTSLRFVRVLEQRADGLVTFEFAIGWPELAVELMLPAPAFDAFCAANKVRRLDA
jgi:phenol/toluene 2-monooxygenase (NADH) P0/A0